MSHFTCLVIGENVDEQLAPFHEFECTGENDQYVQTIDQTDEMLKEYENYKIGCFQDSDGNFHSYYDHEENYKTCFLREPTTEELESIDAYRNGFLNTRPSFKYMNIDEKYFVLQAPEGWSETKTFYKNLYTFRKFLKFYNNTNEVLENETPDIDGKHKFGYTIINLEGDVVATYRRTNPNAKWDWYQIGGRWTGFFKPKKNATGELGKKAWCVESIEEGYVDSIKKGDIDFEYMRAVAAEKAAEKFDKFTQVTNECPNFIPWSVLLEKYGQNYEAARDEYWTQPIIKALQNNEETRMWVHDDLNQFFVSRETFIQNARNRVGCTFAVIKDGKWYERGNMGWWGTVSNEMDENEWQNQFSELFNNLPDDTLLTVVDCHI